MSVTTITLQEMKRAGKKSVFLTAYDWMLARYVGESDVDGILVGDSLGQVFQGRRTTLPVTVEDVIYHARAVRRGAPDRLLVVDMPFLSFQVSSERAVVNAGRILKETDAEAVKVEGGAGVAETVRRITMAGIPVMGHLGLTPQSVHAFGGYGLQAADADGAERILEDAVALAEAGCFAIVLEKIPRSVAAEITRKVPVPTIGIGAGPDTDGQILVTWDVLGFTPEFHPKFVRRYANLDEIVRDGLARFVADVRSEQFPGEAESYD